MSRDSPTSETLERIDYAGDLPGLETPAADPNLKKIAQHDQAFAGLRLERVDLICERCGCASRTSQVGVGYGRYRHELRG